MMKLNAMECEWLLRCTNLSSQGRRFTFLPTRLKPSRIARMPRTAPRVDSPPGQKTSSGVAETPKQPRSQEVVVHK